MNYYYTNDDGLCKLLPIQTKEYTLEELYLVYDDMKSKHRLTKSKYDTSEEEITAYVRAHTLKDITVDSTEFNNLTSKHDELRGSLTLYETALDNVSVVLPTAAVEKDLYTIMAEIKKEAKPDTLDVHHHIAVVAAVGRKMAFRPGISGKIFKALGESGINIRMINQGPDELNIIFGVDNKDFKEAIRVLYNSFVK